MQVAQHLGSRFDVRLPNLFRFHHLLEQPEIALIVLLHVLVVLCNVLSTRLMRIALRAQARASLDDMIAAFGHFLAALP